MTDQPAHQPAVNFAERYGPWALVAGASDGVGAAFARQVADRGLNVVLLARRQQVLAEVATEIRDTYGVEVRTLAVDLAVDDASRSIIDATSDLDVGLLMYCAGADANYQRFLARPVDDALAMVQRNCIVPLQLCHHYAGPMVDRGRGGIILVSSGAAFVGAKNMVAYGATKAFDSILAEALWAELHTEGVDVLGLVLGMTDTPALRRLLVERGQLASADDATPIPDATPAEEVAAIAIAELANGPTSYGAENVRLGAEFFGSMTRHEAVTTMMQLGGEAMGADAEPETAVMSQPTLDAIARQEIAGFLVRYATGIDRRDWTLFATCFTSDCEADYGDIGVWNSAAEITQWMDDMHASLGHTMHRITNQTVWEEDGEVRTRAYIDAVVMMPDNASGVRAIGFYEDVVVHDGEAWRISRRCYTSVAMQTVDNLAAS